MFLSNLDTTIKSLGEFFNVLSNPSRIKILTMLKNTEMDVNEIHKSLEISQSLTSQHLKLLKLNGLVEERREGKHVFYRLKDRKIINIVTGALQFQMLAVTTDPELISMISDLIVNLNA